MKKEIPTNLERAGEAMVAAGQAQDRLLQKEPGSRGGGREMKFEDIQSDCPWMVSDYGVNKKNACSVVSTPTHLNTCRKEKCGFWAWQAKYGERQEMKMLDYVRVENLTKIRLAENVILDVQTGEGFMITETEHSLLYRMLRDIRERMEMAPGDEDKK